MASVFGYIHFSLGKKEIAVAETRLVAAGATTIVIEQPRPFPELGPASLTPLKKQPALFDLLGSAARGDAIMAVRLYHLAPVPPAPRGQRHPYHGGQWRRWRRQPR